MLKERVALGREASPEARSQFLDRLVMQVMVADAAVKKGLDKQPEVADKLELTRLSILADAFVADYRKTNPISDEALKAAYDKYAAEEAGTEYMARHILVDNEADAKAIIAKLKANPKAFEALAKEKSMDTGSKASGGELGWFDPRGMVPEFGKAVVQLAKGKFTETPVKSQFGYHIILLEDSRPKAVLPLEQIKTQFADKIQRDNLNKLVEEMKAKAKIVIVQAPAPAPAEKNAAKKDAGATEPAK
jgi:peptidyl-prolyl cis-trans isomerase C